MMDDQDEHTFLCGFQRTRGYGSLSNPETSKKNYQNVVRHRVTPGDTLQGLVLKYNTSMSEIKRLNRLWSNESFYLKEFIDIPIYEETEVRNTSASVTKPSETVKKKLETNPETVQDIFKRIDLNIRKTTSTIRSSPWNSRIDPYDSAPQLRHGSWHSLKLTSGYQNEAYQDI